MMTRWLHSPVFLILAAMMAFSCTKQKNEPDRQDYADKQAFDSVYAGMLKRKPDSASLLLNNYMISAIKKEDTLNIANAYFQKGKYFDSVGKPDSAFASYNMSRQKYELLKDSLQVAEKLLYIADIYWQYNDYIGIENSSTDVLRFLGKVDTPTDTIYSGIAYNNCGLANIGLRDFEEARKMFAETLKAISDLSARKLAGNNLAWTYMETGDYNLAIGILSPQLQVEAIFPETNAKVLDNLGYSLFKTGKPGALDYMMQSLQIREKEKNNFGLVASYIHLSEYYRGIDMNLAQSYALKAYTSAKTANSPDDRLMALANLRKISSGKTLEKYSSEYIMVNDSIDRIREASKKQFAKIRYDSKQQKEDNLRLKAQNIQATLEAERASNRNVILFLAVFFLIITGTMLYFLMKKRHRLEKIKSAEQAKERISQKIHDELANDMHYAITYAETQDLSDSGKKENLISSLDSMYLRARNISRENSPIDTGNDFPALLAEMLSEYNTDEVTVLLNGVTSVIWHDMHQDKKIAVWRSLQELMVNMKKHSKASLAGLRFEMKGKNVNIIYSDNGVGMSGEKAFLKNGLSNVENRIEAISGTITFESESGKGVKITMVFPA